MIYKVIYIHITTNIYGYSFLHVHFTTNYTVIDDSLINYIHVLVIKALQESVFRGNKH